MIHTIHRDDELVIALNGFPYTVAIDDPRYEDVLSAIEEDDEDSLDELLSIKGRATTMLSDLSEYGIEESGGSYTYKDTPVAFDLGKYLRAALDRGNYMPVVRFIERLFENPSHDTRQRLFAFMDRNSMPIDADGRFMAYKAVTADYLDIHSRSVVNAPGTIVPRMSWSQVDTNPNNTCSRGYHACSKDYLPSFGGPDKRIVSVAIAPEDVGSIPVDYDGAKLRCRQYEVLNDITDAYNDEHRNERQEFGGYIDPESDVDVDVYSSFFNDRY